MLGLVPGLCRCGAQTSDSPASLVAEHELWSVRASVVVVHGLGCLMAHGIFPEQGSDPCPLHWQVDP